MMQNVMEEVMTCFSAQAMSETSAAVGESEAGVRKALPKVVPLVLSSLIKLSEQVGGTDVLWSMAHDAYAAGALTDVVAQSTGTKAQRGRELMKAMLGGGYHSRIETVAAESQIRPDAAEELLNIAAPVMLGVLGQHATQRQLDAVALGRWLQSQRSSISGLMLSEASLAAPPSPAAAGNPGGPDYANAPQPKPQPGAVLADAVAGAGLRVWLWPALIVMGAIIIGYFLGQNRGQVPQAQAGAVVTAGVTEATPEQTRVASLASANAGRAVSRPEGMAAGGRYDAASENYIYDTGQPVRLTLVDGSTQTVGTNSTENKLYTFLADARMQVDSVNRTKGWINFDRVYFDAQKATLTGESMAQLRNVASILKSFPTARVKIGGYTDSTGHFMTNLKLSEQRATAAMAALVDMGVPVSRIETKGYGMKHAIASNQTPVGRSLNRRISVRVIQK